MKEKIKSLILNNIKYIKKVKIHYRNEIEILRKFLKYKHIITLTGLRRSGKTYLMYYLIQKLMKKNKKVLYINFEDPIFFNADYKIFDEIYESFLELFNVSNEKVFFFFDEIQNIKGWERWLTSRYDKNIKFFISGSNSKLLNQQYSHKLTGRHINFTIYPLSFRDIVKFKIKEFNDKSIYLDTVRAKIKRIFKDYITFGSLPEVIFENKKELLKQYLNDIIIKDVILLNNIRYKASVLEIAKHLLTNISSLHSLYSLNKFLTSKSINTIKNYLNYLEDAFILFRVNFFEYSIRKQQTKPFKIYAHDLGLRNVYSFNFSENLGKLLENAVAIELKRRDKEFYYYKTKEGYEVDFVVKEGLKVKQMIQVTAINDINELDNREIRGLLHAKYELMCDELLIITFDYEDEKEFKWFGKTGKIRFVPLWKWLLN